MIALPLLGMFKTALSTLRLKLVVAILTFKFQKFPRDSDGFLSNQDAKTASEMLRRWIRWSAKLSVGTDQQSLPQLLDEVRFLWIHFETLKPLFQKLVSRRVLYPGQAYYNAWYLSRSLRTLGWKADLLNWDLSTGDQIYYHGEDVRFTLDDPYDLERDLRFYVTSLYDYSIYHFSNVTGISYGSVLQDFMTAHIAEHAEIYLLKKLGKKILYNNNGCHDGATRSGFASWGQIPVCSICRFRDNPAVCSDEKSTIWGKFRNEVADYQCLTGGNRVDFNVAPTVHERPEFYCLDPDLWHPDLQIPDRYKLPQNGTVRLYHAVGNMKARTDENGVNIKSSHVYLPLVEKLKAEGLPVELLSPSGVPNKEVRFIQSQADIFLEMLSYGWFGANVREAMMLGKTVICYIRPEWLDSMRLEIPDYVNDLPIVSATPETVEAILRDLIAYPQKRQEIGRKARAFAEKWHAADVAADRFDDIYTKLLQGDPQLLPHYA